MELLQALADAPRATISDLAGALTIPRSTVYRILNSLEAFDIVSKDAQGSYELGPGLLRLGRVVRSGSDLVSIAQPLLAELAREQLCMVKLSVLDKGSAMVVAVAESAQTYSITTKVGRRFPLHAGGASKLLAAYAGEATLAQMFAAPLEQITAATLTSRAALTAEFAQIRAQGYAEDRGEFADGVRALAAPVFDIDGACIAAISVPYLAGTQQEQTDRMLQALLETAKRVTRQVGGKAPG